jgi:hypothetical protein
METSIESAVRRLREILLAQIAEMPEPEPCESLDDPPEPPHRPLFVIAAETLERVEACTLSIAIDARLEGVLLLAVHDVLRAAVLLSDQLWELAAEKQQAINALLFRQAMPEPAVGEETCTIPELQDQAIQALRDAESIAPLIAHLSDLLAKQEQH